jgi:hypothetical protein
VIRFEQIGLDEAKLLKLIEVAGGLSVHDSVRFVAELFCSLDHVMGRPLTENERKSLSNAIELISESMNARKCTGVASDGDECCLDRCHAPPHISPPMAMDRSVPFGRAYLLSRLLLRKEAQE